MGVTSLRGCLLRERSRLFEGKSSEKSDIDDD